MRSNSELDDYIAPHNQGHHCRLLPGDDPGYGVWCNHQRPKFNDAVVPSECGESAACRALNILMIICNCKIGRFSIPNALCNCIISAFHFLHS